MMITDLRVVGNGNTRPSVLQLFGRCIFLVSAGLGIGLLVGLFDREPMSSRPAVRNKRRQNLNRSSRMNRRSTSHRARVLKAAAGIQ